MNLDTIKHAIREVKRVEYLDFMDSTVSVKKIKLIVEELNAANDIEPLGESRSESRGILKFISKRDSYFAMLPNIVQGKTLFRRECDAIGTILSDILQDASLFIRASFFLRTNRLYHAMEDYMKFKPVDYQQLTNRLNIILLLIAYKSFAANLLTTKDIKQVGAEALYWINPSSLPVLHKRKLLTKKHYDMVLRKAIRAYNAKKRSQGGYEDESPDTLNRNIFKSIEKTSRIILAMRICPVKDITI